MSYQDLAPTDAQARLAEDPDLVPLDVRTLPEHHSHRLPGSVHAPVQELHVSWQQLDADQRYLVYCEHGVRSLAACEFLQAEGFGNLINLRGGMAAWIGDELPFERG